MAVVLQTRNVDCKNEFKSSCVMLLEKILARCLCNLRLHLLKMKKERRNLLSGFMLVICTLSHGNADPERGFSINKHMLNIHGTSINRKTIGLRFVKGCILLHGGVNPMDVFQGNYSRNVLWPGSTGKKI